MRLGIIGAPQSGKTTIFNAAAGQQEAVGDFSQAVRRAVIKVPDDRLGALAEIFQPKKITPAEIEFVDAPGLSGSSSGGAQEFSPELRQMDAFIAVINAFTEDASPRTAIDNLVAEMIILDQALLESNIDKRERKANLTGDKSEQQELDLLRRCLQHLEAERPVIELELAPNEEKALRGYQLLSQKPLLFVLNIGENDLGRVAALSDEFGDVVVPGQRDLVAVCGKIEMELMALEDEERTAFMTDLGITAPATELVIQKSYALLGFISFLTAGDPEVRAWTIREGTRAQDAAATIHSDIARGFIRAEVVSFADQIEHRTSANLKAAGKMRLEGKEYIVADGDVILFRFNV